MLREEDHDIVSIEPDYWTQHWKRVGLGSSNALPVSSHGTLLDSESFRVVIASEGALMFAFSIFVAAAGGWTVGVCMAFPENTVLAASKGIRQ